MRINDCFVLQEIADEFIVVPVAEEAERLHGIIKLNETGAFIWRYLSEKSATREEIIRALQSEYKIEKEKATFDTDTFIKKIDSFGCIQYDD